MTMFFIPTIWRRGNDHSFSSNDDVTASYVYKKSHNETRIPERDVTYIVLSVKLFTLTTYSD